MNTHVYTKTQNFQYGIAQSLLNLKCLPIHRFISGTCTPVLKETQGSIVSIVLTNLYKLSRCHYCPATTTRPLCDSQLSCESAVQFHSPLSLYVTRAHVRTYLTKLYSDLRLLGFVEKYKALSKTTGLNCLSRDINYSKSEIWKPLELQRTVESNLFAIQTCSLLKEFRIIIFLRKCALMQGFNLKEAPLLIRSHKIFLLIGNA